MPFTNKDAERRALLCVNPGSAVLPWRGPRSFAKTVENAKPFRILVFNCLPAVYTFKPVFSPLNSPQKPLVLGLFLKKFTTQLFAVQPIPPKTLP